MISEFSCRVDEYGGLFSPARSLRSLPKAGYPLSGECELEEPAPPTTCCPASGSHTKLRLGLLGVPPGQTELSFQSPGVWRFVSPTQLQPFALYPFLPAKAPYPMCLPRSARVSGLLYSSHMVVLFQCACLWRSLGHRIYFPPEVSCPGRRRSLVALTT